MIEITNRDRGPVQLIVRSQNKVTGFTTKILPGRGRKKNVCIITDEEWTEQINTLVELKMISTRRVNPATIKK